MAWKTKMTAIAILTAALAASCDQKSVELPDFGDEQTQGVCGSWYPGGSDNSEEGDDSDDNGASYAIKEGAIFPCLVWNSVRSDGEDTWFNAGEQYLKAKNESSPLKALVLFVSGEGCPACFDLASAIAEEKDTFDDIAKMIGVAININSDEEPFPLSKTHEILVLHDGWPKQWLITNDEEEFMRSDYESFPWIVVVRLSDMLVVKRSNLDFDKTNIDELIELIDEL